MSDRPLLSATLIARNEKHNIRRCFDSLWPHVDQVVLCDTGSRDGTIAEARRYAAERRQTGKLKIVRHKWADDFAAARQAADDAATGEWLVWCDLDDEIIGLDRLRQMAADATEDIVGFFVRYRYAADVDGNSISELWRERVVRNDGTKWEGRLHEHKIFTRGGSAVVRVDPSIAEWVHHRDHLTQRTGERNLRILEKWLKDEPGNARVIVSLAMDYLGQERHEEAADMFDRYLQMPGEAPDRRAQAFRQRAVSLMILNRPHDARALAMQALEETGWQWADTHLTLMETSQTLGRPAEAILHGQVALEIGPPETLLIVNPQQYTAQPRAVMAICYGQMGDPETAMRMCEETLRIAPHYALIETVLPQLRAQLRKHHAVGAVGALVDVLLEAGEPVKARVLLDQAPWYVFDDPRLVERRGQVFRLIRERSGEPKVAVKDEAADAFLARWSQSEEAVAA